MIYKQLLFHNEKECQSKKEEFETKNKKTKVTAKNANQKLKQKKTLNTNIKVVASSSEGEHGMSNNIHMYSESKTVLIKVPTVVKKKVLMATRLRSNTS